MDQLTIGTILTATAIGLDRGRAIEKAELLLRWYLICGISDLGTMV